MEIELWRRGFVPDAFQQAFAGAQVIQAKASRDGLCRRQLLGAILTTWAVTGLPEAVRASSARTIPQRPNCRVIVDNDFAGDPDALVALVHQLLSTKSRVPLVTVTALPDKFRGAVPLGRSVEKGAGLAAELLRLVEPALAGTVRIERGAEGFDPAKARQSLAARAIVAEAMREHSLPLYLTCGGPLTNVAAALRLEPAIAERMTLIWIGGGNYPEGGWEYNLATDIDAARYVIEQTGIALWQVPQVTYRQMQMSVAELQSRLRSSSPLGAWLYDQFTSPPDFVDIGGAWPMGDTPPVILTAVTQESGVHKVQAARRIMDDMRYGEELTGRNITLVEAVDVRLAIEDLFAKLTLAAR